MNTIAQQLQLIRSQIPEGVELVCVSKFHPKESILEAYQAGERVFGESKVQEMTDKQSQLPGDIQWHFIGHLQTNKVKHLAPYVSLIHGVDSFKLLNEIDKQARKHQRNIHCLLQVHIASETTKFGFSAEELTNLAIIEEFNNLQNITIRGLMGMATFTDDLDQVRTEFKTLKHLFDRLKSTTYQHQESFNQISMGMSDDFALAIEEGSTMVRIGSKIFGTRTY